MERAILEKMSSLLNGFSTPKVVFKDGEITIEYDWAYPSAKDSYDNFAKSLKSGYAKGAMAKTPKKKATGNKKAK